MNSPTPKHKRQVKDSQLNQVQDFLYSNIATATMAAVALGIYRPTLCRIKRELEKAALLAEVKRARCPVTNSKAWYLTCNPEMFPIDPQLNLFDL